MGYLKLEDVTQILNCQKIGMSAKQIKAAYPEYGYSAIGKIMRKERWTDVKSNIEIIPPKLTHEDGMFIYHLNHIGGKNVDTISKEFGYDKEQIQGILDCKIFPYLEADYEEKTSIAI